MGTTTAFGSAVAFGLWMVSGATAAESTGAGGAPGRQPADTPTAAATKASEGTGQAKHDWKPLRSADASATSFLQNDWSRYQENYHPNYVLDENPATAWVEGVKGFGERQEITIPLSLVRNARALRLRIWNGYQKSMHLWTKNAMPSAVEITVLGPEEEPVVTVSRTLTRTWGPQEVVVDLPPHRAVTSVLLTIEGVYQGQKFDDTCISDILLDVDSDGPYNAAAENAKHDALLAWVARRKEAAAYFASKPPEFPFAFTKYVAKKTWLDCDEFKQGFAARDTAAKTLGTARYQAFAKASVRTLPDGFGADAQHVDEFAGLFKADGLALVETKDEIVSHVTQQEGMDQIWTSAARVARGADGKTVQAMTIEVRDVYTERSTWTAKRQMLLTYDQSGRLATLYRSVDDNREPDGGDGDDYNTVVDTDEILVVLVRRCRQGQLASGGRVLAAPPTLRKEGHQGPRGPAGPTGRLHGRAGQELLT